MRSPIREKGDPSGHGPIPGTHVYSPPESAFPTISPHLSSLTPATIRHARHQPLFVIPDSDRGSTARGFPFSQYRRGLTGNDSQTAGFQTRPSLLPGPSRLPIGDSPVALLHYAGVLSGIFA